MTINKEKKRKTRIVDRNNRFRNFQGYAEEIQVSKQRKRCKEERHYEKLRGQKPCRKLSKSQNSEDLHLKGGKHCRV